MTMHLMRGGVVSGCPGQFDQADQDQVRGKRQCAAHPSYRPLVPETSESCFAPSLLNPETAARNYPATGGGHQPKPGSLVL